VQQESPLFESEEQEPWFKQQPNELFEPVEWFSNSTYEPYKEQFLIGLDLNSTFNWSGECVGKIFRLVDQVTQL
jgi:hypothetical protein